MVLHAHSGAVGPGRLVSLHLPLRQCCFPWKSEGGGLICRDRSQREGPTTTLDAMVLCVNFIHDNFKTMLRVTGLLVMVCLFVLKQVVGVEGVDKVILYVKGAVPVNGHTVLNKGTFLTL